MSPIKQQQYANLYLTIEAIEERVFSPMCVGKEEIVDTFEDLRNDFASILTDANKKDLEEAEKAYNEYYDNFDNNSVYESDLLLQKAESYLNKVAPNIPQNLADKLL